jgi:hypothetical protein
MKDLTGQKFGRLTAVEVVGRAKCRDSIWSCVCDCGTKTNVRGSSLTNGHTQSCGCLSRELARGRLAISSFRHGFARRGNVHLIYMVWNTMKARCNNPKNNNYKYYGGRGITYCKRWETFDNFCDDMLAGWQPGLSIDRVNNDGNYEKSNCRWATAKQQSNNQRKKGKRI